MPDSHDRWYRWLREVRHGGDAGQLEQRQRVNEAREYRRAMVTAELAWLDGVIADLLSGSLTWSYELLAALALPLQPDGQVVTPPD